MTLIELREGVAARTRWPLDDGGRGFVVPVGRDRKQTVHLEEFREGTDALARVWTPVGPRAKLDAQRLGAALQVNFRLAHGCLALREETLVLTDTHRLADVTVDAVAASAGYLARQADLYEKFIYGTDAH